MLHGHAPVAYAACSCPKIWEAVLWRRLGGWLLALLFFFMGLLGTLDSSSPRSVLLLPSTCFPSQQLAVVLPKVPSAYQTLRVAYPGC